MKSRIAKGLTVVLAVVMLPLAAACSGDSDNHSASTKPSVAAHKTPSLTDAQKSADAAAYAAQVDADKKALEKTATHIVDKTTKVEIAKLKRNHEPLQDQLGVIVTDACRLHPSKAYDDNPTTQEDATFGELTSLYDRSWRATDPKNGWSGASLWAAMQQPGGCRPAPLTHEEKRQQEAHDRALDAG